jgi:ABC-type uncharacterized transport system substrate-binding protein
MKRRDFIKILGGVAASWPIITQAQQSGDARRIGFLMALKDDNPESKERLAALRQALAALGWTEGRNIRIDARFAGPDTELLRKYAAELVALTPDVIVSESSPVIGVLLQATRTIPIVFVNAVDPVGSGYVKSSARPGGNATGFTQFEYRISGKWVELLKEIAPSVSQVAVVRDPRTSAGIGQFAVIQAMAPGGIELFPVNAVSSAEIERGITAFVDSPNGGVVVTSGGTGAYRNMIIALAARHRLPAVYPFRYYSAIGGLISYGPNSIEPTRRAASYVDRILKGEKPSDLPVQTPTKYELVINLKTAKALGLEVPATLFARADELIE